MGGHADQATGELDNSTLIGIREECGGGGSDRK